VLELVAQRMTKKAVAEELNNGVASVYRNIEMKLILAMIVM